MQRSIISIEEYRKMVYPARYAVNSAIDEFEHLKGTPDAGKAHKRLIDANNRLNKIYEDIYNRGRGEVK